ncbi:hypothetical protein [Streptomyces chiangmaiensis]|uniref:hypothetical protein n=1 Tax=Streptomyces chiangmaiensis TaxID=766497 RepID=UPI00362F8403
MSSPDPAHVAEWLGPVPVEALYGIGPRQAKVLRDYGIHCVSCSPTVSACALWPHV